MEKTGGTYVGVEFSDSTIKLFNDILKEFGLTKDFDDKFHCTLVYSKKKLNWFKTSKGDKTKSEVNKLVKIKGFGHFDTEDGKNLHIILDCPYCEAEFARAKKAGATFDYDKYTAHVTLMYNCKDFTYSDQGKQFIGNKVLITNEYIEDLNLDWLDEKVKKDDKPIVEESSTKNHLGEFLKTVNDASHGTPGVPTLTDGVKKFMDDNKKIKEHKQEAFVDPADAIREHLDNK
jgi:hypothetical protein